MTDFFGPLDILCRGLQGQGHRAQQADRRSEESSSQEQRELRQYTEIEWSCHCRHYCDIRRGGDCNCARRCRTRLGCDDEWLARDEAQHGRSCCATNQKTEGARAFRWSRSSETRGTGFSTGRQLRPQVLCQCPASLVWNHSVTRQSDFLTLWAACERAHDLAQHFGPPVPQSRTGSPSKSNLQRPDMRGVTFRDEVEVRLICHGSVVQFTATHESLLPHPLKPWSLVPKEQHTSVPEGQLLAGGFHASQGGQWMTSISHAGCQQPNNDDGIEEVNSASGTPLSLSGQCWTNDWNEEDNGVSGTPPFHGGYRVEGNSFSGTLPVPQVQLRPNPDLITDFDDLVPMSIVTLKDKPSMEILSHPQGGEIAPFTGLHSTMVWHTVMDRKVGGFLSIMDHHSQRGPYLRAS